MIVVSFVVKITQYAVICKLTIKILRFLYFHVSHFFRRLKTAMIIEEIS